MISFSSFRFPTIAPVRRRPSPATTPGSRWSWGPGVALAAVLVLVVGGLDGLSAQEMGNLPQVQSTPSLRPYWHVFAAYAIAIVLIGGWAFSIARRLREVEDRLSRQGE